MVVAVAQTHMEFHEVANLFPLIEGLEFYDLVEDIRVNGLKQPIWTYQGKIVDGRNRYRACLMADVEPRFQEWDGKGSLVAFTISLNVKRRHLTKSQLAIIAPQVEEQFALEAKKRQGTRTDLLPNLVKGEPIHAAEETARVLDVSKGYVIDAKKIQKDAPELIERIKDGTLTIPDAKAIAELPKERQSSVVRKAVQRKEEEGKRVSTAVRDAIWEEEDVQRREKVGKLIADIRQREPAIPSDKYQCLVVDPPWDMQKIEREVRPNQVGFDYPTMNEEELKAFPLPAFAADDCHLYLWTTQKHLPLALRLAEHWGFRYQCLLTWRKNVGFTPFSWMYSTEHILFCTRGHLPLLQMGIRLDFEARVREHSRKPDEFYEIVQKVSPGPRLDVFSREKRDGFDQYGNEVDKYVSA